MADNSELIALAIKADQSKIHLISKTQNLADITDFPVPATTLRVGTLDSLMQLSDDIVKMDAAAEAATFKLYKQYADLTDNAAPSVLGVDALTYATKQWEWDEAKFQLKSPLRELAESISGRVAALDEELKAKVLELNAIKGAITANERKTQGNLMVRGLGDLVGEDDLVETEYMTTLLLVVPKAAVKDFVGSYHKMADFVVPLSGKLLSEDAEFALFSVTVMKKCVAQFKESAREKRVSVRDYVHDPNKQIEESLKQQTDEREYMRLKEMLLTWCSINYAEAFMMQMHLKAIRLFVESVLRYGLSSGPLMSRGGAGGFGGQQIQPNFQAFFIMPKKGKLDALRKVLGELYGSSSADLDLDDNVVVPGAGGGEFFPYVSLSLALEPTL